MNANENKTGWIAMVTMAVVCFGVYLLMRKYVLSDEIQTKDYIIGGAISAGLVIGQLLRNRRKSK